MPFKTFAAQLRFEMEQDDTGVKPTLSGHSLRKLTGPDSPQA
jgi:hypothetical protein